MFEVRTANVVVIGSGAAGLRAAISARQSGAEVVVIGKRSRFDAPTVLASGGINAALGTRDPEDLWEQHFADTLRDGYQATAASSPGPDVGCCIVVRDEGVLRQGLDRLAAIRSLPGDLEVRPSAEGWGDLATACDLRAGLAVAEATLIGALVRRETRGCHNRSDFPALDPALRVNLTVANDPSGGGLGPVVPVPVPPIPAALEAWVAHDWVADHSGRLLE